MVSRGNIDMISALNENRNLEDSFQSELEFLLQEQRNQSIIERERELNIYRSGSAPPTVEGSLSAVDSLFRHSDYRESNIRSINNNNGVLSEDEIRSHPAYLTYYYSHDNVNPRLPPPLLSKEDWRVALRFQESGSSFRQVEDWRRKLDDGGSSSSLFSMQPGISMHHREKDLEELRNSGGRNLSRQASSEWHDRPADGLIGLSSNGLGTRRKSFADILQEGLDRPNSLSGQISRPTSHNAFGDTIDETTITDPRLPGIYNGVGSIKALRNRVASAGPVGGQSLGNTIPHSFSSAVGSSLSRSTTPEPQLVGRSPSPGVPPVGSRVSAGSKVPDGHSSGVAELNDIANNLSSLNLSNIRHGGEDTHIQSQLHQHLDKQPGFLFNMPYDHSTALQHQVTDYPINENLLVPYNYVDISTKNGIVNVSKMTSMDQVNFSKRTDNNLYSKASSSGFGSVERSSTEFADHMPGHFAIDEKLNSTVNNHLNAGYGGIQSSSGARGHVPSDLYSPELNFTPGTSDYAAHARSNNLDPSQLRNYSGVTRNLEGLQTAYVEELLSQQKRQYELSFLGKSGGYTQRYYGSPSYGHGIPYLGNPMSGSGLSSVASGYQMLQNERVSCFNSMMRSSMGGYIGSWHTDLGSSIEGRPSSSLLDEFKSNKSKSFELSDITNHVVEFSTDQYGSRFIQQKLETTTVEEKSQIFPEIIPHARTLMTDVFGNYVIQKFFEYGTKGQREELASQLTGHVLPLSLQMYGCRVIQKALEVVDVDRQTQMVAELDGSVMKCVRDQNGNHVIQKCIECVPQDRIQFIISAFYGQVIALSTHPYGCRVIQRVLEHCDDLSTQQTIMEEIMRSVCPLSQDQYGNYVIQHVLEQGKPHERSAIISKLAGQIVQMSQQKYASNVVEKCLTFGGPDERQLLVNEMLGSTDENEPLQAMMKDPFGNYVVQKILETCDDRSLELLLSRIRVHLNSLKKYTYGKHIVSRVEKLIMTGEMRIGLSSKGIVPN